MLVKFVWVLNLHFRLSFKKVHYDLFFLNLSQESIFRTKSLMTIAREISSNYNPLSFKVISFETVILFNNFMNAICTVLLFVQLLWTFLMTKIIRISLYKVSKWQTVIAFCLFYSFRFLKTLMGWSQKLDYDWFIFDEAHMIF